MLRITACIIVIICSSALGFLKAASYKARVRELESILELMKLLDLQITYRRDWLSRAFEKVSASKECWFSGVLLHCSTMINSGKDLQESWKVSIEKNKEHCPLRQKDITILEDLSLGLGKSDISGHRSIMEPAVMRLEESLEESKQQSLRQGRMYRSMGIGAGIVMAVILI